jgi:AsmA-like C-terminal region
MRKLIIGLLLVLAVLGIGAYVAAQQIFGSDRARLMLQDKLSERFGQRVQIGSAGVAVYPRPGLDLRDVTIGEPAIVQFGRVQVATRLGGLLSRRIEDAEVIVSGSRVELPKLLALVPAAAAPSTEPGTPGVVAIASIRTIALRDVTLVSGPNEVKVDLESSLEGDRLRIIDLKARAGKTRLGASGTFDLARFEGTLLATADPMNLDELIAIGSALSSTAAPVPSAGRRPAGAPGSTPMKITMKVTAPKGEFAGNAFRDLSTTIEIVPGRIVMAPLTVRILGGGVQGRIDGDTARAVPRIRLTGRVEGIDVAEVMKAAASPGAMTGRLAATVSLAAEGTEADTLMKTARGTIAGVITDGTLPHLDLVRTVVLAFGKPSGVPPAGAGSAFSKLDGTFVLANGALTTDSLAMSSRDFDVHGRGTLRLPATSVEAAGDVVLSSELTSQAGTDLKR